MSAMRGGDDTRSSLELMPWLVPLTDGIVACKDGSMLACYEITGLDLDGSGADAQRELAASADRFMEAFRDRPVTLWWTVHRQRSAEYPTGEFRALVARLMDDDNRATFEAGGNFRNRHFVSVLWTPGTGASGVIDRISNFIAEGLSPLRAMIEGAKSALANRSAFAFRAAEVEQSIQEFEPILERAESSFYASSPRRMRGKELLGFLWACANPGVRMVEKAWDGASFLDGYLPEKPVSVFADTLAFGDASSRMYGAAISLKAPPVEGTAFSAFAGLLMLPCELTLSITFRVSSTSDTKKHIAAIKRVNEAARYPITAYLAGAARGGQMNESKADPARTEAVNEVLAAQGEMTAGRTLFGMTNVTLMLYNEDSEDLDGIVRDTIRVLYAGKFVGAIRESIHLLSSWSTTLPGQWQMCRRWLMLSAQNAVDLAPLVGVSDGEIVNAHLSEQMGQTMPCLTALSTEYRTPFYLNLHSGGVGHAMVMGPSGSGKSVGMNFLISQWSRYPGARTLIFDKDYSCKIATLLQGGSHLDLRPGSNISLNPLAMISDPLHRPWVSGWVASLISSRGYRVTTADAKVIAEAVADLASASDRLLFNLSGLSAILPTILRDELSPWVRESSSETPGQFSGYFDNHIDDFELSGTLTAIEMNDVMREPMVARAFLDYAFYRLRLLLEGSAGERVFPTLIYIEECWFMMQDEQFLDRLIDWLKTFRKLNASVLMATQSLEDIAGLPPRVLAALRDNVLTRIYLPNASALSETAFPLYNKTMGLTEDQVGRIAHATPREDYFVVKPGVARMVKMRLTPLQVAACRSDQRAQRAFKRHYRPDEPIETWAMNYINEMMES
ncbi:MAG: Type IV secretion system protein virB4 [Chloroflexi bacterium]|nr:Type IV secretion system protein virB4 [Chloroflexota bacterium]